MATSNANTQTQAETATETETPLQRLLNMTVRDIVLPVFDQSWITDNDNRETIVANFRGLYAATGKVRQSFDDCLKAEHLKGKLLKVEHIRKPKTVETKTQTLESFLSK